MHTGPQAGSPGPGTEGASAGTDLSTSSKGTNSSCPRLILCLPEFVQEPDACSTSLFALKTLAPPLHPAAGCCCLAEHCAQGMGHCAQGMGLHVAQPGVPHLQDACALCSIGPEDCLLLPSKMVAPCFLVVSADCIHAVQQHKYGLADCPGLDLGMAGGHGDSAGQCSCVNHTCQYAPGLQRWIWPCLEQTPVLTSIRQLLSTTREAVAQTGLAVQGAQAA